MKKLTFMMSAMLVSSTAFAQQIENPQWNQELENEFNRQIQQQLQQEQQRQQMLNEIRALPSQEEIQRQQQQQMQQQMQQLQQQQQQILIAQMQQYGASHPQQYNHVQVPAPFSGQVTPAQWHGYLVHVFDKFYLHQYPGYPASITADTSVNNVLVAHVVSESAAKDAMRREITGGALKDLHALRDQLLRDTKYHTGGAALPVGVIAKSINSFSNLLLSTLLITEAGEGGPALKEAIDKTHAGVAYETLNEALIEGRFDKEFLEDTFATAAAHDALPDMPLLIELAMEFKGFAEGLISVGDLARDQKELREEVSRQLQRIDREIDRYNQRMRQLEKQGGGTVMQQTRIEADMRMEEYLLSARIYQKTREAAVTKAEKNAVK